MMYIVVQATKVCFVFVLFFVVFFLILGSYYIGTVLGDSLTNICTKNSGIRHLFIYDMENFP